MGNRVTRESMEFIAGEIMDAVHASDRQDMARSQRGRDGGGRNRRISGKGGMTMNMNKRNNCAITFKNQEHEMFYRNFLQNCKSGDVYHKALAYCLGISGDTRRNVEWIYDFEEDFIKTECLGEGWITSGSARVVCMAFNLFCNGTPSVYALEGDAKVKECQRYTVEDLFCCEYAVYFWEAVKVRYPEYCFPVDLSEFGV